MAYAFGSICALRGPVGLGCLRLGAISMLLCPCLNVTQLNQSVMGRFQVFEFMSAFGAHSAASKADSLREAGTLIGAVSRRCKSGWVMCRFHKMVKVATCTMAFRDHGS